MACGNQLPTRGMMPFREKSLIQCEKPADMTDAMSRNSMHTHQNIYNGTTVWTGDRLVGDLCQQSLAACTCQGLHGFFLSIARVWFRIS